MSSTSDGGSDVASGTLPVWRNREILVGILGILAFTTALFTAYKLGQIQQKREEAQDRTEQVESIQCRQDEDCVVAIRLDQCCSCPEALSRQAVRKDKNLVEYEFGKDYSREKNVDCSGIHCVPCLPLNKAICESGKCKGVFEKEMSVQDSVEGKFCGGIAANLLENQCPSGYKCQLEGNYPDASGRCVRE